jgi:hypothetical protein
MKLAPFAGQGASRAARFLLSGLLGSLAFAVTGCATVGREFPPNRVSEIKIGKTTKSELLGMFGRPYRRGIEDGDSTWTYLRYKIRLIGGQSDTRDLYVRFDGDQVRSYTYNADAP